MVAHLNGMCPFAYGNSAVVYQFVYVKPLGTCHFRDVATAPALRGAVPGGGVPIVVQATVGRWGDVSRSRLASPKAS